FASLSDAGTIEVKDEWDEGNMQFADTDGDGMFNFEDQCPALAGVARFEGCPVPDSDGDGINDEEDHCPFEAGSDAGNGCPAENITAASYTIGAVSNEQLNTAAFSTVVKFEADNDLLLSTGDFNTVLQLADQALHNTGVQIDIYASTDLNAAAQANTVMQYLKDLGVSNKQISVSAKNTGAGAVMGGVEVQLRY
ncbi:MAG TPA: thrombospondin type 3 repeat-containing protein, partial [Agriterribacter sp.]|nr:thrombospondin type 3 repeat-containing protein [Agriterribacter sp.]